MVILVTSARAGEGKTTTAANLGVSFGQAGERVIVVDADLRRANVHDLYAIRNEIGFSSVVAKSLPLAEAIQTVSIPGGTVDVLTAGPRERNPAELLITARTAELFSD